MAKSLEEKVVQPIAQEMATDKQKLDGLQQEVQKLMPVFQMLQQLTAKDQLAARAEKRKDAAVTAKIHRDDTKAQADIALAQEKAKGELSVLEQKTAGELQIRAVEAAHGAAVKAATAPEPKKSE
jgi:hypothetical protein